MISDASNLLQEEPGRLAAWAEPWTLERTAGCMGMIVLGAGCYGAAMGWWRAPLQALFVSLKFPLILLLTALGNALLNSMLAPLLGVRAGIRQTFRAMLASFAIAAIILGAFSPVVAFLAWSAPPLESEGPARTTAYSLIMVTHVFVIALAGIAANARLYRLLCGLSGSRAAAGRVMVAWLAGNLLLGSQLSWNLRPFIGAPLLEVEFLRPNAFEGNFFEAVFRSVLQLTT
jgi:hypothetical protein